MSDEKQRPEWVPDKGGTEYTTNVMRGVEGGHDGMPPQPGNQAARQGNNPRRRQLSVEEHVEGVLNGDRTILARTITLVESNSAAHMEKAQEVLKHLIPHTGNSIRVGITGVPGVGKSSFIEALGTFLCDREHKLAVMAVDPTSSVTRGSILGDKTRMENLSRNPRAFIRPSPTGGTLGGVTRKSRETILVCEAAGFDVILVETVGVGQSEVTVRSMVDFFLLLMLTGAGDELQGIKKGVIELADALLINKADGENKLRAQTARSEYNRALHYLAPATEGWKTRAYTCSAMTGEGIENIWDVIQTFRQQTGDSGVFDKRRKNQTLDWVYSMVEEHLRSRFFNHPGVKAERPQVEHAVVEGTMPATVAAQELLQTFEGRELRTGN
jgi:LAO/AO transport system kinase